jgi:hypothetical protein
MASSAGKLASGDPEPPSTFPIETVLARTRSASHAALAIPGSAVPQLCG